MSRWSPSDANGRDGAPGRISRDSEQRWEWRGGSEPAERLRWYHDNERATKSPQDMVRESALFQADGGAGCETNEHATTGRIPEQMARAEMEEQRQNRTTERGGPRCSARRARESSRVFRVAAIGASLSFLQRWSFLQKGHTPLPAAKPFWALGRR
ncbi:hypothetical protein ACHAPE_002873 [Trichoderma viride]